MSARVTWPKESVYTCSLLRNEHRRPLPPDHVTFRYSRHRQPSCLENRKGSEKERDARLLGNPPSECQALPPALLEATLRDAERVESSQHGSVISSHCQSNPFIHSLPLDETCLSFGGPQGVVSWVPHSPRLCPGGLRSPPLTMRPHDVPRAVAAGFPVLGPEAAPS